MGRKKKTRLEEILTPENYKLVMEIYNKFKKKGDLEKILFFKSFVSVCLRNSPASFNEFLSYVIDKEELVKMIENSYFDNYKWHGFVFLYDEKMTHYELI